MHPVMSRRAGLALFGAGALLALLSLVGLSCTNLAGSMGCQQAYDSAYGLIVLGIGLMALGIILPWAEVGDRG